MMETVVLSITLYLFTLALRRILNKLVSQWKLPRDDWWLVFILWSPFLLLYGIFLFGLADRKLRATFMVHLHKNICL